MEHVENQLDWLEEKPKTIIRTKTITTKPRLVYKEQDYPWWLVIVAAILFILLIIKR